MVQLCVAGRVPIRGRDVPVRSRDGTDMVTAVARPASGNQAIYILLYGWHGDADGAGDRSTSSRRGCWSVVYPTWAHELPFRSAQRSGRPTPSSVARRAASRPPRRCCATRHPPPRRPNPSASAGVKQLQPRRLLSLQARVRARAAQRKLRRTRPTPSTRDLRRSPQSCTLRAGQQTRGPAEIRARPLRRSLRVR